MDIKTVADLAKLADICRKKGIKQLKITQEGLEFSMGEKPQPKVKFKDSPEALDTRPSDEEMLFWSSAGIPN